MSSVLHGLWLTVARVWPLNDIQALQEVRAVAVWRSICAAGCGVGWHLRNSNFKLPAACSQRCEAACQQGCCLV
jgi:hypothetical protein